MAGETGPRFAYRAFGVTLVADRPVDYLAGVAIDPSAPASLEFRHAPERVGSLAETAGRAGVVDAVRDPTGAPLLQILRTADGEILRFPGIGDFALSGNLVLWAGAAGASDLDLATVMLSAVVGYWLEERGRPILHASGVVIDGRAWLFAAPSGGGKSGLAAWLAATGCELLGDDVVALEAAESGWRAHPSFPVMRMWPDLATALGVDPGSLGPTQSTRDKRLVPIGCGGFGRFAGSSAPLDAVVVAARRPAADVTLPIRLDRLAPADAFADLIRCSYVARLAGAVGLDRRRFPLVGDLAARVPVYRLDYPSGFGHMPDVTAALLREAAAIQGGRRR